MEAAPPQPKIETRSDQPNRYSGELNEGSRIKNKHHLKQGLTGDVWSAQLVQSDGAIHNVIVKSITMPDQIFELPGIPLSRPPEMKDYAWNDYMQRYAEYQGYVTTNTAEMNSLTDEALAIEVLNTDDPNHPYGPHLYGTMEVNTEDGKRIMLLVEERIIGHSLDDFMDKEKPDLAATMAITRGILRQQAILHKRNIMHRDIKAQNIMIRADDGATPLEDRVVLVDLGNTADPRDLQNKFSLYSEDERMAMTLCYFPPEAVNEESINLELSSDIFSIGVVIAELLLTEPAEDFYVRHSILRPEEKRKLDWPIARRIRRYMMRGDYVRHMKNDLRQKGVDEAHITWLLKALDPQKENRYKDADAMLAAIPTKEAVLEAKEKSMLAIPAANLIAKILRDTGYSLKRADKISVPNLQCMAGNEPITIGWFASKIPGMMRYGIRIGNEKRILRREKDILSAFDNQTRDVLAPLLYALGREHPLGEEVVSSALALGGITKATQIDSNGNKQTVIFLPHKRTGKIVAFYPGTSEIENITTEDLREITDFLNRTQIQSEISSHPNGSITIKDSLIQ